MRILDLKRGRLQHMRTALICGVLVVGALGAAAQDVELASVQSSETTARVIRDQGGNIRLEATPAGAQARTITLGPEMRESTVEALALSPARTRAIAVLSAKFPAARVLVADIASGQLVHDFYSASAVVSPDGGLIAAARLFAKTDPNAHEELVVVVPEGSGAVQNPPGLFDWPIPNAITFFPPDTERRAGKTPMTWLSSSILAFLDGVGDPEDSEYTAVLVALEFASNGAVVRSQLKTLDARRFAAPDYTSKTGFPPARALGQPVLTKLEATGLVIRMSFAYDWVLKVRQADVVMW